MAIALTAALSLPASAEDARGAGAAAASSGGHKVSIAAEGFSQPWGLAEAKDGGLYVVQGQNGIKRWADGEPLEVTGSAEEGYLDGTAKAAAFLNPTFAVTDDKGILYIADTDNHVVRRLENGEVYTVAGNGTAGFSDGKRGEARLHAPTGLAIDAQGHIYVADTLNHVIRRIAPDGQVTTFAGKGGEEGGYLDAPVATARFNEPTGLAIDERGGLYVADTGNSVIRYIFEGRVTTYAGKETDKDELTGYMTGGYRNGAGSEALFDRPRGLAYAEGVLFVADSLNNRIRAVRSNGTVVTLAGSSSPGNEAGTGEAAGFNQPSALLYSNGVLYVSDTLNGSLKALQVDPSQPLSPVRSAADLIASTELLPPGETPQVWMDGELMAFQNGKMPFAKGEPAEFYIPVRRLLEVWGADIVWKEESRSIVATKGDWSVELFTASDKEVVLRGGSAYAAAGYLAERAGFLLAVDEEYKAVLLDSGSK